MCKHEVSLFVQSFIVYWAKGSQCFLFFLFAGTQTNDADCTAAIGTQTEPCATGSIGTQTDMEIKIAEPQSDDQYVSLCSFKPLFFLFSRNDLSRFLTTTGQIK